MSSADQTMYVPYSSNDEEWGLYLLDIGKHRTLAGENYPAGAHPPDYIFNFKKGRVLSEYQLVYVFEGEGEFESKASGKVKVETGSVMILYPGMWHRYRPRKDLGWREAWIGFSGRIADHVLSTKGFDPKYPVIKVGIQSRLIEIYDQVLFDCKEGEPGYQQVAAGLVMELLGLIQLYVRTGGSRNKVIQNQIHQSRDIIAEHFREELDQIELAESVGMSYSNFRKQFRHFTGLSPVQYIIQLRIREAKSLLFQTNKSIKQIGSEIGFNSSYYFVRLFKSKVGVTPGAFRQRARGLSD
jgi:AraC-like DNA-binding protein